MQGSEGLPGLGHSPSHLVRVGETALLSKSFCSPPLDVVADVIVGELAA